eukprot:gene4471-6322_t
MSKSVTLSQSINKQELKEEFLKLTSQEEYINKELQNYFRAFATSKSFHSQVSQPLSSRGATFESIDMTHGLTKIKNFTPCFEAMLQDSKKMTSQIDDCRALSDRLSGLVRRLDTMQIRAQHSLACTEDIMNLKDCKIKLCAAIDEKNLVSAVSYIRLVHEIDLKAAKTSDDYEIIIQKEQELKEMVQKEFSNAIASSNIKSVMALCPLLQTLGLEAEARDSFMEFVEKSIFVAISADASSVEGATTDPATGYAQALSSIFNSGVLIIQQYLPMVIQGMENSLGDVHFIRKLHKKCEKESGLVLKRYMKFRSIKETLSGLKNITQSNKIAINSADIHSLMDELALLIQYCCKYMKYLKNICHGAELKTRSPSTHNQLANSTAVNVPVIVTVFAGPTDFDKMVDELINKNYMEGEQWLMKSGLKNVLPKSIDDGVVKLDECFFVLQKCAFRALATNNIHAACAVLHYISDLLSSDLLSQASEMLFTSIAKISSVLQDHMNKYRKTIINSDEPAKSTTGTSLTIGIASAISLASTIGATNTENNNDDTHTFMTKDEDDPWGVSQTMEAFNVIELCMRYSDRLNKDISSAGARIFSNNDDNNSHSHQVNEEQKHPGSGKLSVRSKAPLASVASSELDKLKLCKEDFEAAKLSFSQLLRQGIDRLIPTVQIIVKELLTAVFGKSNSYGGLKFDEPDSTFDNQFIINLLPKVIITPLENMINITTMNLSDNNKNAMIQMLVDVTCERIESMITQTTFRFAGALKLEEIIRSITSLYTRHATVPIRNNFSRLREVMLVLTSDSTVSSLGNITDNFTQLTTADVEVFIGLRIDLNH